MSQVIEYHSFGKPLEVLTFKESETPVPEQGEALLEMLYANINPSDMGMIGGSYGKLPELPTTPGREGVAKVVKIEGDAQGINVGDLVRIPEGCGAWQQFCTAPTADLFVIPSEIDPKQAATLFINPTTALMLLENFVDLKPGDWVIQNAANSSVGTWVIQLAKAMGLRTINVVRREELKDELENLGADIVIVEDKNYPKELTKLTDGNKPKLALNSIGGESVINLVKSLDNGGVCVTFGGMVGDLVRFPTRFLIFNDVQLRGFWMDKWMRNHTREAVEALYQKIYNFVITNDIKTPIQSEYSLQDFEQAITEFSQPRMGKVLFKGTAS